MRIVMDTNQHISAIIQPKGKPAKILHCWHIGTIELAISLPMLQELRTVVHRPRYSTKVQLIK